MHEEIFLTDHLENILSTILFELDHGPWAMRMRFRIAETVVALDAAEGKEHRHIERSVDLIQILLREVHLLRHEALHEAAGACFEFDTHGLPALAFFNWRSTSTTRSCASSSSIARSASRVMRKGCASKRS